MSITKPFNFRAGTKARANEVNEDFDVLYSQVNTNQSDISELDLKIVDLENTKAEINGSASQRFAVADALNTSDAINKGTMLKYNANIRPFINGLRIIKDSGSPKDTIIVTSGVCYDSKLEYVITVPQDTSKKNNTQSINSTYYVHVISNKPSNNYDVLISTDQSDPALPSGYFHYRCIGYYTTDKNGNIDLIKFFSNSVDQDTFPLYEKAVVITAPYTFNKKGYISVYFNNTFNDGGGDVYINGCIVASARGGSNNGYPDSTTSIVPVSKDDKMTRGGNLIPTIKFMPCREA